MGRTQGAKLQILPASLSTHNHTDGVCRGTLHPWPLPLETKGLALVEMENLLQVAWDMGPGGPATYIATTTAPATVSLGLRVIIVIPNGHKGQFGGGKVREEGRTHTSMMCQRGVLHFMGEPKLNRGPP